MIIEGVAGIRLQLGKMCVFYNKVSKLGCAKLVSWLKPFEPYRIYLYLGKKTCQNFGDSFCRWDVLYFT